MTAQDLTRFVKRQRAHLPITGPHPKNSDVYYSSQKEHWLTYLDLGCEPDRSAKQIYSAVKNSTMLLYLAEAAGVEKRLLLAAKGKKWHEFKKVIPWELVEKGIRGGKP